MVIKQKKKPPVSERDKLKAELTDIKQMLSTTESLFNMSVDGDLISYYSLELKALQAKFSHVLKKIKALDEQSRGVDITAEVMDVGAVSTEVDAVQL